jgi:hypothetical protein
VIFPEPVTLNLFLALELVFTFGIFFSIYFYTLLAFRTGGNLWSLVGNQPLLRLIEMGCKTTLKI